MRKPLNFYILFLVICSCSNNNIIIKNSETELKNGVFSIGKTEIELEKYELDSLGFKTYYKQRNDTLFLLAENEEYGLSKVAWIKQTNRKTVNLNCERKITITSNEISFSFCYSDVISLLNSYEKKNDVAYNHLTTAKYILENTKESTVSETKYFNDGLITKLISKIPFECNSSIGNDFIKYLFINEFHYSVFHGYDNYIVNNKKDTIASLSYIDRHSIVDLWEKW